MKRIALALLSIALATPSPAAVPGAEELADVILTLDGNRDTSIDSTEFRAGTADGFDEIDRDRDGRITPAEIDALGGVIASEKGSVAGALVPPLIKLVLGTMDKDGDKVLTREEYTAGAQGIFALLDADRNGTLTRAELIGLPGQMVKAAVR